MASDQALIIAEIQLVEDKMKNDLNTYRAAEVTTLAN